MTLELGGKSPMLVFADCDFDRTVAGAITSMRFTRQGQSCTAASRIYVERPIFERFVAALAARVDAMVMGDPLDEKTDIGTIISDGQFAKVRAFIEEGRATPGATAHVCSRLPADPALRRGKFMQPVIFTGLPNSSRLVQEEIFGPVTVVFPFDDAEAALAAANNSEYGLAASVWTNNLKLGLDLAHRLEAGLVQVNQNLVVQAEYFLWWGEVLRAGQGGQPGVDAGALHPQEDDHGELLLSGFRLAQFQPGQRLAEFRYRGVVLPFPEQARRGGPKLAALARERRRHTEGMRDPQRDGHILDHQVEPETGGEFSRQHELAEFLLRAVVHPVEAFRTSVIRAGSRPNFCPISSASMPIRKPPARDQVVQRLHRLARHRRRRNGGWWCPSPAAPAARVQHRRRRRPP